MIAGIVLALAAFDFVVQNTIEVPVHFLFFETDKPLWALLVITSVLAIVAAELIAIAIRRTRRDGRHTRNPTQHNPELCCAEWENEWAGQRRCRRRPRSLWRTPSGSACAQTARHSSSLGYIRGTSSGRMRLSFAK